MRKRIIVLFLSMAILATLCSCKSRSDIIDDVASFFDTTSQNDELEFSDKSEEPYTVSSDTKIPSGSSSASDIINSQEGGTDESENKPTVSIGNEVKVEETVVKGGEIKEPENTGTVETITFNNKHNAVLEEDYFQYNTLNEKEKELYKRIVETINSSNNIVDVSNLSVYSDDVTYAFQKVLADYPQFFYISRSCLLVYNSKGKTVKALVLSYTDGTVTDQFDKQMNLTRKADRQVINSKISQLKSAVENVVSKISSETADVIKEKIIHDHIAKTVEYDHDSAANIDSYGAVIPHAFDLYGAAVERLAVCEGYSKWFQYLCYNVGINATQVFGTANGGNHMWNSVLIEDDWYFVDLTWNDANNMVIYSHFNLTFTQITKHHTVDSSVVAIPSCTSGKNSFANKFAICVADLKEEPTDFEEKIENIKLSGDKRIFIIFEDYDKAYKNTEKYTDYIQRYFLWFKSKFNLYLLDQGMELSQKISLCEDYFIIEAK